ncbi:MAG: peptide chain release factor N(5)-glutamine methyltransferase [Candidatus Parcubacteria bacterium]|jgi:release factor glutamine methyltransferase
MLVVEDSASICYYTTNYMKNQEIEWLLREKYNGEKSEAFFADCARLEAGEPLAYIIGSIPFLDATIHLDSHPLIPRPETEYWVEKAITIIKNFSRRAVLREGPPFGMIRVLDLCAGSGAIGVAVAKAIPGASVTFAEIDPTHLPTIKKNLTENTTIYSSIKYPTVESDLFANIDGTFDFILTNPPYIDKAADTVEESVALHEPHLGLFGGADGMEIIERIMAGARASLAPQGQLWIEHEPFQCEAIAALAIAHQFSVTHHCDQYDTYRYSILTPLVAE